jgi:hypothetical protein
MTNGGSPYNSYTPAITIWNANTNAAVITAASMTQVSTSAIYKYDFTAFVYGVPYVYLITGDVGVAANERFQWGNVMQDIPDRTIGTVQIDGGNSVTQFKGDQTESSADFWKDALCLFLSGTLVGQVKKVTAYNGTTHILTFTNGFTSTPTNGDSYALINF